MIKYLIINSDGGEIAEFEAASKASTEKLQMIAWGLGYGKKTGFELRDTVKIVKQKDHYVDDYEIQNYM